MVVDTNILVSALLSAAEQLDEIGHVTRYPRIRERLHPAAAGRLVNDLRALAVTWTPCPSVDASSDPDDNDLLAMAVAGSADFLITGDKRDLLSLGTHAGTRIISARTFLDLHGKHP